MNFTFLFTPGRNARQRLLELGEAPSEFFYGAIELARAGHSVKNVEVDESRPSLAAKITDLCTPLRWRPVKTSACLAEAVRRERGRLECSEVIVATTGNLAFATAAAHMRPPVLGIHSGTLDYHHGWLRRRRSRRLLLASHTMLFGDAELEPFRRFFALGADSVSVNQFGVDLNFWHPSPDTARDGSVLSIGNDGRRDYTTLLAAAAEIRAPIEIITRRILPSPLPENVSLRPGSWQGAELSDLALRERYQRAACVVVPVLKTLQPSGQSVTLQAMACGCPVVLADFPGLWNRASLRDGENVLLYPAGNPAALVSAVRRILTDSTLAARLGTAARATAGQHGDIHAFAGRIAELARKTLSS